MGRKLAALFFFLTQILVLVHWPNNCFDIRETFVNALLPLIKNNPGCVNGSADVAANIIEPALHPRVEIAVARGFETFSALCHDKGYSCGDKILGDVISTFENIKLPSTITMDKET